MQTHVVVARTFLAEVQAQLTAAPDSGVRVEAGARRAGARLELFVPAASPLGEDAVAARLSRTLPPVAAPAARPTLELALGADGSVTGRLLVGRRAIDVDAVRLSGARMERWRRGDLRHRRRTTRERLRGLHVAVVGCARLGSALALGLARAGIGRLTLVDGDVLEDHSLDAVECFAADVGRPKVEAVVGYLAEVAPAVRVRTIAAPVEGAAAFEACSGADLVASAPDDNRARLAAALAATAHLRPHLDLGTGVFVEAGIWTAGADVRLMLPADGCVLCAGGLDLSRGRAAHWRRERAGSLRSLNQMAAGQALALVEALVAGGLERSTWVRLLLEQDGGMEALEMPWEVDPACPLCRRGGTGEAVWRV